MRYVFALTCGLLVAGTSQALAQFKLDIEKVADKMSAHESDEDELHRLLGRQVQQEAMELQIERLFFRVGKNEAEAKKALAGQLESAIKRMAKTYDLSEAQQAKLRLAGDIDIARTLAEMQPLRGNVDPRNRQELINMLNRLRPFHTKLRSMFRSRPRMGPQSPLSFGEPTSLFERTANTMRPEPRTDTIQDQAQSRQQQQVKAEIKATLENLEAKWKQSLRKRKGKIE